MLDAKAIKQSLDEIQAIIDAREKNLEDWERASDKHPVEADEAFMPAIQLQDDLLVDAVPELMEYARAFLASLPPPEPTYAPPEKCHACGGSKVWANPNMEIVACPDCNGSGYERRKPADGAGG